MGPPSSLSFAEAIILSHFALFFSKQGKNPVLTSGRSTGNVECNADCMTRYYLSSNLCNYVLPMLFIFKKDSDRQWLKLSRLTILGDERLLLRRLTLHFLLIVRG